MRSLTISNLVLIILNNSNNDELRKQAEMELKRRLKYNKVSYDEVLYEEGIRIEQRGFDINNYLFSNNPTIQQLMELYFSYVYNNSWNNNLLLFSERHLCNQMNFCSSFFDKICENAINKINDELEFLLFNFNGDFINLHNLEVARNILQKRKKYMLEEQQKEFRKLDILEFNESLLYFDDYGCNYSKNDILNRLYGLKFVLSDSMKLKKQKNSLLKQSKDSLVNYNSEIIQKSLTRAK